MSTVYTQYAYYMFPLHLWPYSGRSITMAIIENPFLTINKLKILSLNLVSYIRVCAKRYCNIYFAPVPVAARSKA